MVVDRDIWSLEFQHQYTRPCFTHGTRDAVGEPAHLDLSVFLLKFSQPNTFKRAFDTFQKWYQTSSNEDTLLCLWSNYLVYYVEADLSKTPPESCLFSNRCSSCRCKELMIRDDRPLFFLFFLVRIRITEENKELRI
jgi:hypothetical protein